MKTDDKYKQWDLVRQQFDARIEKHLTSLSESETLTHDILSRFSGDQGKTMISYKELSEFEFDVWFPVSCGVRFKRVKNTKKPVYFITEMDPSKTENGIAEFGIQKHDCKELCKVKEGHLIEILERKKRYSKGEKVIYPPFYRHKPSASVYSIYGVEFIKTTQEVKI